MSEEVVTVFRLVGRKQQKGHPQGTGNCKHDLLIQPMMVREAGERKKEVSDALGDD